MPHYRQLGILRPVHETGEAYAVKTAANSRDVPYQSLIKVRLQEKLRARQAAACFKQADGQRYLRSPDPVTSPCGDVAVGW
jgi:hypothetical protein